MNWRNLVGFEGYYEISEYGDIRNVKTGKLRKNKINSTHGYAEVDLYIDGKVYYRRVHSLVAETFIGIPDDRDLNIVMHLDNNKTNNHYTNLKWGTVSDNTKQAYDDELITMPKQNISCELFNEYMSIKFDSIRELSEYINYSDSRVSDYINKNIPIKKGLYKNWYVRKN